jgi:undecaprenyl diphosphate synthase
MADNAHHVTPGHVAIIMDGNGRWASARGLPRIAGHREGAKAVRRTIQAAIDQGVRFLTLFAFSSENWQRPPAEVSDLTFLLKHYLRSELDELHDQGVCLRIIGERDRFGPHLAGEIDTAVAKTAHNKRLTLVMALSYGGRADIVAAARGALAAGLAPDELTEARFAGFLSTDGIPDPDLLIRTSGEMRISNFLLWQTAYAEMVFTDVLWPDFGSEDFARALGAFATRERRFGARPV